MASVAERIYGFARSEGASTNTPDWASLLVAGGLLLAFLAVGLGVPSTLPLQAASWLTFVALVITPGYLLGDILTWRLDLDLLERLAMSLPLGICVMAVPGMVAMLTHRTLAELASAWTLTVGFLAGVWVFHLVVRRVGSSRHRCPPWTWGEVAMLLLLVAAFVYVYPTLSLYKMDGDAYAVATFTSDALTGRPLNATEPILGTGQSMGTIRMGFNQMLPVFHLWTYFSGVDHIELTGTATRSMLALWAILAAYMLGKAAGGSRRMGLLVALIQMLIYLTAPFVRSDHVSIFFFERINADKFTVTVTMLPVLAALAIRFLRVGRWELWITAALCALAVSSIHALIAAMAALSLGAFGALHLLLNPLRSQAWVRVAGLAALVAVVMILPLVQLLEARNGEALAPTYPSTFEGWPIEERLVPVLPFKLFPTLDLYGPLPDLAYLEAEDVNTPTNPFLIWRFALNMRRGRIILFDLDRYISDPTIILEPPYLLALVLLPLLLYRLRSDLGAQFALSTSLAVMFVLFNPILTPKLGAMVMPWILWRFVWLLPYALIIALATDRLLAALAWILTRPLGLQSLTPAFKAIGPLAVIVLAVYLLQPNITANLEEIHARGPAPFVYATPERILDRLRKETAGSGPVMVMADGELSVTIPAFVGNADIVAHRILSTAEMFPADQQDLALQRHIDQYDFLNTPLLTPRHIDILQRYGIGYLVIPGGTSLEAQLRLSPQWFQWLVSDGGYSLYAVRQLPSVTESIQGNAAFLRHQWDTARKHYQSALEQDPSDALALLGMADFYRARGQFDRALTVLRGMLEHDELPVVHYRLGQLYTDMGQEERSIDEFDVAQRGEPSVALYRTALADACLSAGRGECAEVQLEAAVDTLGLDSVQRLIVLASLWEQRGSSDLALPLYEQAAALRPDGATRLQLADAYRRAERFEEAEKLLYALWQAYPLHVDADVPLRALTAMARLAADQGEIEQAEGLYRWVIWEQELLARDTRLTRLALAQTLLDTGYLEQARDEIEATLRLQPHNATAYVLLGNLYRSQYDPTMAMRAYQYALQLDPTEASAYTSLSDQRRQQAASPDESLALMQRAVSFNPEQPILALTLADQFRRLGEVDMAITTYQQALGWLETGGVSLGTNPQPARRTRALTYSRLAALYEDLGQIDAAMNFYQAAVSAAPDQVWTLITLGDALRRRDQVAAAEQAYREAGESDPSQVDSYLRLASLQGDRGDPAGALALYQEALQTAMAAPNSAQASRAWLALGSFYNQSPPPEIPLGSDDEFPTVNGSEHSITEKALVAYHQALEAEASVAGVRALSRLYQDLGQTEEAIQLFKQSIQQGEQQGWVPTLLAQYYVGLGDAYLGGQQVDEALATFGQAVNLDGWWAGARLALARGYSEAGDQAGALAEFQRAVEIAPGSVDAQLALAGSLEEQGDGEQALEIYQTAVQAHPGSAAANLSLARAWQARGRWDLAEQSYRQAIAMVPGEAEAYVGLANLIIRHARYDEAETLLREALRIDRGNPAAYLALADLLARQARHDEAVDAYQGALEVTAEDATGVLLASHTGLAEVYRALGELEQAEKSLQQAMALEVTPPMDSNTVAPPGAGAEVGGTPGTAQAVAGTPSAAAATEGTPIAPFLQLADLYEERGQLDRVEQTLLSALERSQGEAAQPRSAIRQALARFYQSMGSGDKALEQLRLALEEDPGSMVLLASYAAQLRLNGREELAKEAYRQAERAAEPSGAGYGALAADRRLLGEDEEAAALLDRAIIHDPEDAGNWIRKGQAPFQGSPRVQPGASETESALASLAKATELAPAEGRGWFALGDGLLASENTQEAVNVLERAIAVEATYLPAHGALAEAYQELGQSEKSATIVRLAQETVPGSYLGYLYEARLLEDGERWDEARTALEQAIARAPGLPQPYLEIAQLEQAQGHEEEAAHWYQQVIDLRPGDRTAHLNLVDLALGQGDVLKALALAEGALEMRPGDAALLLRRGRLLRMLGRYSEAESSLVRAARLDPLDDSAHAELAGVHLAQGEPAKAIMAYDQAIALRPDQASHYTGLSQAWTAQGRPEHALALLREALPVVSRPAALYSTMSQLYLRRGEPALALEILEDGLREQGEDTQLLLALATYYQSQADFDRAEQTYRRAMTAYAEEAEPTGGNPALALAGFQVSRGQVAEALAEYERAVTQDPQNANALLALGNAYSLLGQEEEAIAAYFRTMALPLQAEGAYSSLAALYRRQARWSDALEVYETGKTAVPTSASLLLEESDLLFQRGDEAGALNLLDQAIQRSPSARTYIARAALYRTLGRTDDALRDLEAARQLEPGSVEALVALGNLYQGQGKVAEAKDAYRHATSLVPGVAAPYLGLADLAIQQGDQNEALWQLNAAHTAEPASADPLVGLAAARAGQGDWEEAEADYRQALDLAPASTVAHLGLADAIQARSSNLDSALGALQQITGPGIDRSTVYLAMGELCQNTPTAPGCSRELTEGFFHQAAQLAPASPQGYLALVGLYLEEGRPREAEGFAKLALEIAPRDPAVRISLGSAYQMLGDYDVAESHYQEAIDLDATRPDGYNALAGLYLAQEKHSEAIAAYEKAMEIAPLDWSLWVSVGNVHTEQENHDQALSAYERAAEMNPDVPEPWLLQGDVYVAKKKWTSAQGKYEQAQMLRPDQADALLRLASLFEEREKLSQAENYARQATEVDPVPAAGWITLGRILSTNEEFSKAAEAYLAALQRDPRRRAAYDRWMRCYTDITRQPYNVDRSRLETELGKLAKSDQAGTVWAQALLGLGWLSLEKNTDEAIGYLEEAVRLDSGFVELYRELAPAYEKDLDGRRALEAWQRYVYASPPGTDTGDAEKKIDSLLQVHIEQPVDGGIVSDSVEFTGTATAKDFQSYRLRFKAAESSDEWSEIATANSQVEQGLLATWDTSGLAPGVYRLRLDVTAKEDVPYDEIWVDVKPAD